MLTVRSTDSPSHVTCVAVFAPKDLLQHTQNRTRTGAGSRVWQDAKHGCYFPPRADVLPGCHRVCELRSRGTGELCPRTAVVTVAWET